MKTTTQQDKLSFIRPAMLVCGIALGLVSVQTGFGQQAMPKQVPVVQNEAAISRPASSPAPASLSTPMPGGPDDEHAPTPKGPGKEGIRVHGHWVIDVRNPDGTLVEHRDFQNSLTSGGAAGTAAVTTGDQYLVALISGTGVPSPLGIAFIQGQNGAATLTAAGDTSSFCNHTGIVCGFWGAANSFFPNAGSGMNITANFAPAASLVLSGNYTVPSNLTGIDAVQSYFQFCAASALGGDTGPMKGSVAFGTGNIAPNACYSGSSNSGITVLGTFTYTLVNNNSGVPTRLVVTPGQILSVIVTISFS